MSSLLRHADTLFHQLETDCGAITDRTVKLKARITILGEKSDNLNARKVKIRKYIFLSICVSRIYILDTNLLLLVQSILI